MSTHFPFDPHSFSSLNLSFLRPLPPCPRLLRSTVVRHWRVQCPPSTGHSALAGPPRAPMVRQHLRAKQTREAGPFRLPQKQTLYEAKAQQAQVKLRPVLGELVSASLITSTSVISGSSASHLPSSSRFLQSRVLPFTSFTPLQPQYRVCQIQSY